MLPAKPVEKNKETIELTAIPVSEKLAVFSSRASCDNKATKSLERGTTGIGSGVLHRIPSVCSSNDNTSGAKD